MNSRMDRYETTSDEHLTRSEKNASLYKEIYGNYDSFENLPIDEHSNEMEISNLDSVISKRSTRVMAKEEPQEENLNINYDMPKEEKVYDINTLLEKAKEENAKIKKEELKITKNIPNYLANLESDKKTLDLITKYEKDIDEDMPIVHDVTTLTKEITIDKETTSSLSLDILSDLKPTGDTIITEPLKEKTAKIELETDAYKEEKEIEKEFYSGKMKFTKEDFASDDDEDFLDKKNNHTFLKIILIVIGLSSLFTATYFILKEYFDINLF